MVETWKLGDANKSSTYLLPLVGAKVDVFCGKFEPQSLYVNTFSGAEERPELNKHVFVLYRYKENTKFKQLDQKLRSLPTFYECYDPDRYHVMYVFEIPDKYLQGLENFRLGKYSQIKEEIKEQILNFWNIEKSPNKKNPVYGTLYRQEYQYRHLEEAYNISIPRSMENSSIPDLNKEIYLDKYKQYDKSMARTE